MNKRQNTNVQMKLLPMAN